MIAIPVASALAFQPAFLHRKDAQIQRQTSKARVKFEKLPKKHPTLDCSVSHTGALGETAYVEFWKLVDSASLPVAR